jgi:2'-5' RNA ligase
MGETISGSYGIAIVPDRHTREEAQRLAKQLMPTGSFQMGANGELPHITLYHGKIENASLDELMGIRDDAETMLKRARLALGPIDIAGGKFVFWNLTAEGAGLEELKHAHNLALSMSAYLKQGDAAKALREEGLSLSPAEVDNCNKFGHPWVSDLYRPHITLGYAENGIDPFELRFVNSEHHMTVERVILFEVGFPGIVAREIDPERGHDRGISVSL